MKKWCIVLCSAALLAGCADHKKRLEGERLPVVNYAPSVGVDQRTVGREVVISKGKDNSGWTQPAGQPNHAMPPVGFDEDWSKSWKISMGTGSKSDARLLSTPVVSDDVVYTLDTRMRLRAFSESSGKQLWERELAPEGKGGPIPGGGLAYENGIVFATSPYAEAIALDAESGEIMWKQTTEAPLRAAPTVADGRVYVLSINNQLDVFDTQTGKKLWSHAGITEYAGLLGMASPAVSRGVVIVTYSSGEVYALKAETGYELWSETLSPTRRPDSLSSLAHIKAHPIIDGMIVIVVGHNQKMAALDLRNGSRVWERRIGGIQTPAVASDYIFMVNNFNELLCMVKDTGEIVWLQKLPVDPKNPHRVMWAGPVIAGNNLYLTGMDGNVLVFSPQGKERAKHAVGDKMVVPPVVSHRQMYIQTDNGYLLSYK